MSIKFLLGDVQKQVSVISPVERDVWNYLIYRGNTERGCIWHNASRRRKRKKIYKTKRVECNDVSKY
jgi:hypothetical protein